MALSRIAVALAVALAASAPARAVDPHLPADTQAYVSINLRKAFDSKLFKDNVLEPARDAIKAARPVADLLDELGLDPFKDLDRVIICSPMAKEADRGLVILHGSFSEVKLKAKANKLKKEKDEYVKVHEVPLGGGAKHDVYELAVPGKDASLFVALASAKVVLVSPGKDYIIDALKQGRSGKKVALKNKDLQDLVEGLDAKQALTVAVPGKVLAPLGKLDFMPAKTRDALKHVEAIGGGITVGDSVKLELAITTKNAENAKELREAMKMASKLALAALGFLGNDSPEVNLAFDVVKSIKVTGRGKVVGLSATLTAEMLRDLFGKND